METRTHNTYFYLLKGENNGTYVVNESSIPFEGYEEESFVNEEDRKALEEYMEKGTSSNVNGFKKRRLSHHRIRRLPLNRKEKAGPSTRLGKLDAVIFIILFLFALSIIFPFYYLFLVSITPQDIYADTRFLMWTPVISFDAYHEVFSNQAIWNGLGITCILLFGGTLYQLFFTVITGYALSRNNWFGKNFVMNMILVTMFFGGGLIPYYVLIKTLGMIDTIWVMIIPGAIDTFNMLLMRNYFASLPKELEESARVDGANDVQIFVRIFLPLSLPMLATIGLFFAVGNWNSWYNGMLFNSSQSLKTLQQVLQDVIFSGSSTIPNPNPSKINTQSIQMAAIFFTILPMMCFYPFLQRYFVKGIVVGAIKG
jgi:putative aldouronate transport system permease protein